MTARPAPAAWRGRRPSRRLPPVIDAVVSLICVALSVGMVVAIAWSATS